MCSRFCCTLRYGFFDNPMQTSSIKLRTAPFFGHHGSKCSSRNMCSVNGVWCSVSKPVNKLFELLSEYSNCVNSTPKSTRLKCYLVHCRWGNAKFCPLLSSMPFSQSNFVAPLTFVAGVRAFPICSTLLMSHPYVQVVPQPRICQAVDRQICRLHFLLDERVLCNGEHFKCKWFEEFVGFVRLNLPSFELITDFIENWSTTSAIEFNWLIVTKKKTIFIRHSISVSCWILTMSSQLTV